MAKKKKAPEAEKENGERWLVSYADFMTLLLGLFIILYSRAAADAETAGSDGAHQASVIAAIAEAFGGSPVFETNNSSIIDLGALEQIIESDIEAANFEDMEEKIEDFAEKEGLLNNVEVIIDENGLHIRLTDDVLFGSGSYTLNNKAKLTLTTIGSILKTLPNNHILVEGHTDNIPTNTNGVISSNWELGALRATTVAKLLINDCALSPKYIATVSYGEHQPIETNTTVEGRAANRRVEIKVLRNYPVTQDANLIPNE